MSKLREEIRSILREELTTILVQQKSFCVEEVQIGNSEDLNVFVGELLGRFSDSDFVDKVRRGELRFCLKSSSSESVSTLVGSSVGQQKSFLDKQLITEADLVSFGTGCLRVPMSARITPLAKDEAQRKGIRIERVDV